MMVKSTEKNRKDFQLKALLMIIPANMSVGACIAGAKINLFVIADI